MANDSFVDSVSPIVPGATGNKFLSCSPMRPEESLNYSTASERDTTVILDNDGATFRRVDSKKKFSTLRIENQVLSDSQAQRIATEPLSSLLANLKYDNIVDPQEDSTAMEGGRYPVPEALSASFSEIEGGPKDKCTNSFLNISSQVTPPNQQALHESTTTSSFGNEKSSI